LIVNVGEETTLSWDGSDNATYTITYWDGTQEVSEIVEGPVYKYPVKDLQQSTTFYLVAEARVLDKTVTTQRERTVTVIQVAPTPTSAPSGSLPISFLNVSIDNVMVTGETYANDPYIGSPGETVIVQLDYEIVREEYCPNCFVQIQVGFHDSEPLDCIYSGVPGIDGTSGVAEIQVPLPDNPGNYYLAFDRSQADTCPSKWWNGEPKDYQYLLEIEVR
jgi:hypothetical protein